MLTGKLKCKVTKFRSFRKTEISYDAANYTQVYVNYWNKFACIKYLHLHYVDKTAWKSCQVIDEAVLNTIDF